MRDPTAYPELNDVLAELVESVRTVLGDNFCGAYLQGSFAVGDADEHSDVDFIVVTHDEVTEAQEADLQAMHQRIYALDTPWAQHLEGSYITGELLRRVDPARSPLLYLDNGATEFDRDSHCNTAVVRWSVREHGVVLAGPDPKSLVEPVSAAELRDDVLAEMQGWVDWLPTAPRLSRRAQGLIVLSFCRILQTIAGGRVTSKREAGEWALEALDPEWSELIQSALDDRPDPWAKVREQADPELLARTLAFTDYCATLAASGASA